MPTAIWVLQPLEPHAKAWLAEDPLRWKDAHACGIDRPMSRRVDVHAVPAAPSPQDPKRGQRAT